MSINRHKFIFMVFPAVLSAMLLISGCGGSGESNLETGLAKLRESNYKEAVNSLQKAADQMPNNATARCNLGIAYWKLGRHKDALVCFKKAAQLSPDDVRPLEFEAQVLIDMQSWNEARNVLVQANKRLPSSPRILTSMALVEFRAGNNAQALARLNQALNTDPAYAPALYNMAILQRDRMNNKEAATNYFQNYLKVAGTASRIKDIPQFLNKVPPIVQVQQVPDKVTKQPVTDQFMAGIKKAIDKQEYDSALEMLKQAVKKDPNDSTVLWELAVLYDKYLKYNDKAAEVYLKFVQQFPNEPRVASARKRMEEIKPLTKQTPQQKPETNVVNNKAQEAAQIAFQEGLNYQNEQKWDKAIACYKRAFELDSSLSVAAYNLGLVYKSKDELDLAKQSFGLALNVDPNMTKAHYMLAVIYNLQKDNRHAVTQLNNIFRVDPDYAKAHLLMGVIMKDENNIEGAKAHFEKYIKLAPEDPSAKMAKEWLNSLGN
jgi:tetratricopeptide (TPR) repeat protein